jgi:hypothetical protein
VNARGFFFSATALLETGAKFVQRAAVQARESLLLSDAPSAVKKTAYRFPLIN